MTLSREEVGGLVQHTEGYSGSDMANCIADVLLEPVRELEHATCWRPGGRDQYCPCDSTHPEALCQILADIPPQQVRFCVLVESILCYFSFTHISKCVFMKQALQHNSCTIAHHDFGEYT